MIETARRTLRNRSRTGAIAVLVAAVGFVVLGGALGAASALAVATVWLLFPAVYAVAIGHVLVAALTVGGATPLDLLVVELGLFAVLLSPAATLYRREMIVSVTVFAMGALVFTFGIVSTTSDALPVPVLALVATWTLAAYGLYRYELVSLEHVEGST